MLSLWAAKPPKNASTKPIVIVTISEVSWGIRVLLRRLRPTCPPIMRHWLHSEYFSRAPLIHWSGSPHATGGRNNRDHLSQHIMIVVSGAACTRKKHARA